ncbi:hypothetical protein [Halobacillus salinus]|nr:hypothetical protein [Halobacillus salinus]
MFYATGAELGGTVVESSSEKETYVQATKDTKNDQIVSEERGRLFIIKVAAITHVVVGKVERPRFG